MKLLVIPSTDWIGHPVPNRLNFIFDRLATEHQIDVCHFKLFQDQKRETMCNLIPMDEQPHLDVKTYYIKRFSGHSHKISQISQNYDAIVSSNIIPGFTAALQDTPLIIDFLDYFPESVSSYFDSPLKSLSERVASFITKINLKKSAGVITPTDRFKQMLDDVVDSQIHVIPNGVDIGLIKQTDADEIEKRYSLSYPVIGYVGSIERWIDLEMILNLFPSIKRRYQDATFLIVGPGLHTDFSQRLKRKALELNIDDSVIFTGGMKYEKLSSYISAMDVGINPRKDLKMNTYTMGSKVLNYLACGVPVLSKNMPVMEELFGPEEGVFTYSDENDFLGKFHKALRTNVDPSIVGEFDWDRLAVKYEKALYDILE